MGRYKEDAMDPSQDEMVEIITEELQGAMLRPKLDAVAARVAARHLVKRLALRKIEWRRSPPRALHGSPPIGDSSR